MNKLNYRLSDAEKRFIIDGVNHDFRADGRHCWDTRESNVSIDLLPTCAGSSRVQSGKNHILVGIKADLVVPDNIHKPRGFINFFVHLSGPLDDGEQSHTHELVNIFEESFKDCKFLDDLIVADGKNVWSLFVDILILEEESKPSLYDLCSIAVKAALISSRLPGVHLNLAKDIELSDQPLDYISLDVNDVPLFVTITKIGDSYVVDPTEEEEASSISSIVFSLTNKGEFVYSLKLGSGGLRCEPFINQVSKITSLCFRKHEDIEKRCADLLSK